MTPLSVRGFGREGGRVRRFRLHSVEGIYDERYISSYEYIGSKPVFGAVPRNPSALRHVTLVLLFGFQGKQILAQPMIIGLLAVPILIQVYFNSGLAYWLNRRFGVAHCVAAPSALIGASNFFELAVATAIVLFGFDSGAALATVVGVLIEVPVMLSVVRIVNNTKGWYEAGLGKQQRAN